ncbi:MAG: hypothetical protein HEQ33_01195 [Dolichospermum sp. WA123]|nr:hypothetical protein [Dolichospermum sp. WA123]
MLVGAKHLEDKLSVIAKNSSPNASPVQLVGAKHLEDKLSVIAKNSSPNASPVQWSVVKEYFSPLPPAPCLLFRTGIIILIANNIIFSEIFAILDFNQNQGNYTGIF